MKVYQVSYYSSCGTYFQSYLKSVTLSAENEDDAREKAKAWCKKNYNFLIEDSSKWCVTELVSDRFGVLDYDHSSDY